MNLRAANSETIERNRTYVRIANEIFRQLRRLGFTVRIVARATDGKSAELVIGEQYLIEVKRNGVTSQQLLSFQDDRDIPAVVDGIDSFHPDGEQREAARQRKARAAARKRATR